ncbi:MAG: YwaF family protein [Sphaerochaetaceae bacterium]|nr:YwaF family protein [Sphaerochaetaceae bacterium]
MSCIEIYPSADGSVMLPYLELQHLPFHLCSIHIFTILYCTYAKGSITENNKKQTILRIIYPTATIGAFFAIILPSIFNTTIPVSQAFSHPIAYQTFLYHSMLIILGLYIPMSGEVSFSWKGYRQTMIAIISTGVLAIYLNSMLATVVYKNEEIISVEYVTNFLFLYKTPIGIALNTKLAWLIYLAILIVLAFVLVFIFYLALRKKKVWDAGTEE